MLDHKYLHDHQGLETCTLERMNLDLLAAKFRMMDTLQNEMPLIFDN